MANGEQGAGDCGEPRRNALVDKWKPKRRLGAVGHACDVDAPWIDLELGPATLRTMAAMNVMLSTLTSLGYARTRDPVFLAACPSG